MLSVDAIYSYVRDAVSLSLGPGSNDAAGMPIPPFLPQTLTATFSDNSGVMLLGKYAVGPLEVVRRLRVDSLYGTERPADSFH